MSQILSMSSNLETKRLILKRITQNRPFPDMYFIPAHMNIAIHESARELSARFSWMHPEPPSAHDTRITYQNMLEKDRHGEGYYFAVYAKEPKGEDVFVAFVSLEARERCLPAFSIGYWCSTLHAGKGYVSEAVDALCHLAIHTLKVRRLDLTPATDNHASIAIAEKVVDKFGFERVGVKKNAWRHIQTNELCHCVIYAFTQAD